MEGERAEVVRREVILTDAGENLARQDFHDMARRRVDGLEASFCDLNDEEGPTASHTPGRLSSG